MTVVMAPFEFCFLRCNVMKSSQWNLCSLVSSIVVLEVLPRQTG